MRILGFDTSHGKCSVAITEGDRVIGAFVSESVSAQAEELLLMTERLLYDTGLSYEEIEYLAVSRGPGSFTGIRIGLAAARGIVMASDIRPISVSTFEALNFRTLHGAKKFDHSVILINAYRSQVYAQSFDHAGVATLEPVMLDLGECADYLKQFKGVVVAAGSGLEHVEVPSGILSLVRFPQPEARSICRLANMQLERGIYSSDLSPLYIRAPDAKLPQK